MTVATAELVRPPSRITEADLLLTVGRPLRVVDCACGGQIAAVRDDWNDIAEAVRTHQGGKPHKAWRRELGL